MGLFVIAGANDFMSAIYKDYDYDFANDTIGELESVIELSDIITPLPIHDVPGSNEGKKIYRISPPDNQHYVAMYDYETGLVTIYQKVGNITVSMPYTMTLEQYKNMERQRSMQNYWDQSSSNPEGETGPGTWRVGGEVFETIFGSNVINVQSQGMAEVQLGIKNTKIENPTLQERQRNITTFDFQQKMQVNVRGSVGERLKLGISYNTESTFDFDNQISIEFVGQEDDILKKIEAGNVTLPLPGTLIQGSQSLFGIKTELQFGKLTVTSILSQQKGQSSTLNIQGGAQTHEFDVSIEDYDRNRHFFLAHSFRDHYNNAMRTLPVITSPFNITKIEVWVTNRSGNFNTARNIVAFTDLAEGVGRNNSVAHISKPTLWNPAQVVGPSNEANSLFQRMTTTYGAIRDISQITQTISGILQTASDYEKIENARMLTQTDYTLNTKLGYISLNTSLNADEVLAVAYEYTYNGETFKVGEFTNTGPEAPNTLILKLLKGTVLTPDVKTWNLMMKNIYAIGAYQLSSDDFIFNVSYMNDSTGSYINYFPEGTKPDDHFDGVKGRLFIDLLGLDKLDKRLEPFPDGQFDFVPGYTINTNQGRIIFPVLEPFGQDMQDVLNRDPIFRNDTTLRNKFIFKELYASTLTNAAQYAEQNKYRLTGTYKSSVSSEISLNAFNLPPGSVVVTAGGIRLTENVDYIVDYSAGRISIINAGLLQSGTPIQVSLESQSLFSMMTKTMMGTHLDYRFTDNFNVGATIMHLRERPLTQKVTYGDEPIANTIWGLNSSYTTEVQGLTYLIDKIPLVQTKTPSSISIDGEFAHLIPGHPKVIQKEGTAYIDDFEGTKISFDLRHWLSWKLSSVPQDPVLFGHTASLTNDLRIGYDRAKLAWYSIDPLFVRKSNLKPSHLASDLDQQSNNYVREVHQSDLFPERDTPTGEPTNMTTLNLAYYPDERGPYNFDPNNIDRDGKLLNPASRFGGIMRRIEQGQNDFELANINQIEFWLLDPFIYHDYDLIDQTVYNRRSHSGGDLYINLGDISEDILRDSRKFFEQGLPGPGDPVDVDTTAWGYVPKKQSLVNAFDTNPETILAQDVGFNGMNSEKERTFYSAFMSTMEQMRASGLLSEDAYSKIWNDPASDDFHYFRGTDYDNEQRNILDRYKDFNNPEGNSRPSQFSPESYPTAATNTPDAEDINNDNTLNETESYYQFKIRLSPNEMNLDNKYITHIQEAPNKNRQDEIVRWYKFSIPLNAPDTIIGGKPDLRSVRFMRMFLHGFEEPVILRFATMELVRAEWREYEPETDDINLHWRTTPFQISAVNIEEHSRRTPVNYVLPPGVTRVIDPSSPSVNQLNEQALSLKVNNLKAGDAKAVYKSTNYDMRPYRRLKMDVHAEALEGIELKDDEVVAFIRLGTDFRNNYYEYSVPLKVTPPGSYSKENTAARYAVWPLENFFDIPLELFQDIKLKRNDAKRHEGSTVSNMTRFEWYDPDRPNNRVTIKGNPNLGNVKVIMIGIRNNTGTEKFAEVWVNELRLSDFDESGGWAASARTSVKLADLGNVSVAGTVSTIGFGSINQSVTERSQADFYQYDIASNLELGKFLGPENRLSVPLYVGFSEAVTTPKYSPLEPDIELKTILENTENKNDRDSIKLISQDVVKRKSYNFTNVRLLPKSMDMRFYDVSNLSATYSYNEMTQTNANTEYLIDKSYRGILGYNFMNRPKTFEPFKGITHKHLTIIKDFNIIPAPTQVGYRWEMIRNYREVQLRNINDPDFQLPVAVSKDFYWNRYFDLGYNLTKALKINFNNATNSVIDEPEGIVNKRLYADEYELWKDSVMQNIMKFGRMATYQHTLTISYVVPINKLPYLDWVTANAAYSAGYMWQKAPVVHPYEDENGNLVIYEWGNTIQNNNMMQGTGNLNFATIYNKSEYLKNINRPASQAQRKTAETMRYSQNNVNMKQDTVFVVTHNLGTTTIQLQVFNQSGQPVTGKQNVVDGNKVEFTPSTTVNNARIRVTGTKPIPPEPAHKVILEFGARLLTSLKTINISYSQNNGTVLPGYMPKAKFIGTQDNMNAPGVPFIFGWQNRDFAMKAIDNEWVTTDNSLNTPYTMMRADNFQIRASLEPLRGLKIELTGDHRFSNNMSEYYLFDDNGDFRGVFNTMEVGNHSMTFNIFNTAFNPVSKRGTYESETYDDFIENRDIISQRLIQLRRDGGGYLSGTDGDGYGRTSQEVMIPAFLAAYSGKRAGKIFLDPMPGYGKIQPNWRVSYDGLSKIKALQKYIRTFDLTHAYRSIYTVTNYQTNLDWEKSTRNGFTLEKDASGNYLPFYEITGVTLAEDFSPLLGFNIVWVNSLSTRAEYKTGRMLNLSLTNNQLIENYTQEWVIGFGYRFDRMDLILGTREGKRPMSSDLNLRLDFGIRDNFSVIRRIEEEVNQITAGTKTLTIKFTADYMLADKVNVQLYYDRQGNRPYISTGYPVTNNSFGVSFRLSLAN